MRRVLATGALILAGMFALQNDATAGEMKVTIEIPQLRVSEYHRPYIAAWIEDEDNQVAANLTVWYQLKHPTDQSGTKWLPDLRQWWRKSGRSLELPVDGLTGATRPVGEHKLIFSADDERLTNLKSGSYTLNVEASREVGGRELLQIKFDWPAKKSQSFNVEGKEELGTIGLTIQP